MDYNIDVKELTPPIGNKLKYYATVTFYQKGFKTTNNGINEVYGITKEEARDNIEAKVKELMRTNKK